jgi:hypothetical protein
LFRSFAVAALGLGAMAPAILVAAPPKPVVLLELKAPRTSKASLPIEMSSGWPLKFRARTFNALGIGVDKLPPEFPILGREGYVVLEDPDGCFEVPPPGFATRSPACVNTPTDETYIEFHPDVDQVGVPDDVGNPGRSAALADPAVSGEPLLLSQTDDDPLIIETVPVGPVTGAFAVDGIGYGADDDWASFVLLVPTGNGLVLNPDFSRPAVLTLRNLAGFFNWNAYELNDGFGGIAVEGGMVVPYGLVMPLMLSDDCADPLDGSRCLGFSRYRIDGGPVVTAPVAGSLGNAQFTYPAVVGSMTFEGRVFIVSGVAPSLLSDGNGDGNVTAADAKLAGYTVISNEVVFRFRMYHGEPCGVGLANVVRGDLDGNGRAISDFVCPTGPGQVKTPPN